MLVYYRRFASLFLTFSTIISQLQGQICTSEARRFLSNAGPRSIISADFNNDSIPDLAIAHDLVGSISVLLGDGYGKFAIPINLTLPYWPYSVCSADFNNDGNADLAAVEPANAGRITVILGKGDGRFEKIKHFATGPNPWHIITGDYNNDGNVDLATAGGYMDGSGVSVSLGDGSGNFAEYSGIAPNNSAYSICNGDFNQDGNLDLVLASTLEALVLFGNGKGQFSNDTRLFPGGCYGVCSGDFNNDNLLDIASSVNFVKNSVAVWLGTGNGTFGKGKTFEVQEFPTFICSIDFNSDGNVDLAIAHARSKSLSILSGDGTGAFNKRTDLDVGYNQYTIISADFNRDHKPDIATNLRSNDSTVAVFLNCSTPEPKEPENYSIYPNPSNGEFSIQLSMAGAQTIHIYDLNGELLLSKQVGDNVVIDLRNLEDGIYTAKITDNDHTTTKKLVITKSLESLPPR